MPDWSNLLRSELTELSSYLPADPPGIRVRLDANEAPYNPAPNVREVVTRAVADTVMERYPDARARRLKERISSRTGARADELLVGTGSDEIIGMILTAMARARPGIARPTIVIPTPTFVMYRTTARSHGYESIEVPLDAQWDLDVAAMEQVLQKARPNVVFIASPNNPTSNRMSEDRLAAIVEAARESLVVLDEAYVDYAGPSLRSWRSRFSNLAVMRTLSKVGFAAIRVGWLEADEGLIREIDKVRLPFNVSATSLAVASAIFDEAWDDVRRHVEDVVHERIRVASALSRMGGVDVVRSDANFLWIGTTLPAVDVYKSLVARGVLVRSFHAAGGRLSNRLRVTIGAREENDAFLQAFREATTVR